MPDLYFCRDPEKIEKEGLAAAEKAVTEEEFQGERTAPAQSEDANWSEGAGTLCTQSAVPTEDWNTQSATDNRSVAPTVQATEWVGMTTEGSYTVLPQALKPEMEIRLTEDKEFLKKKKKKVQRAEGRAASHLGFPKPKPTGVLFVPPKQT